MFWFLSQEYDYLHLLFLLNNVRIGRNLSFNGYAHSVLEFWLWGHLTHLIGFMINKKGVWVGALASFWHWLILRPSSKSFAYAFYYVCSQPTTILTRPPQMNCMAKIGYKSPNYVTIRQIIGGNGSFTDELGFFCAYGDTTWICHDLRDLHLLDYTPYNNISAPFSPFYRENVLIVRNY